MQVEPTPQVVDYVDCTEWYEVEGVGLGDLLMQPEHTEVVTDIGLAHNASVISQLFIPDS